jgi:homoserine kinase
VLAGLAGAMAFDPQAMTDVLHEPARLAAMAGSGTLVAALRQRGVGACLSGAGPTVLAVVPSGDEAALGRPRAGGDGFEVRAVRWDRAGAIACPPTVVPADR